MKSSVATLLTLWASTVATFDKNQRAYLQALHYWYWLYLAAWGKRDYSCVNVFQGIPDNSTVAPGSTIQIRFNREPTTRCPDPLTQYPGDSYSVWLYNNPVRNRNALSFDESMPLVSGIPEADGSVTITIPVDLPPVSDSSVWYLRVSTSLLTAPQVGVPLLLGRIP